MRAAGGDTLLEHVSLHYCRASSEEQDDLQNLLTLLLICSPLEHGFYSGLVKTALLSNHWRLLAAALGSTAEQDRAALADQLLSEPGRMYGAQRCLTVLASHCSASMLPRCFELALDQLDVETLHVVLM